MANELYCLTVIIRVGVLGPFQTSKVSFSAVNGKAWLLFEYR